MTKKLGIIAIICILGLAVFYGTSLSGDDDKMKGHPPMAGHGHMQAMSDHMHMMKMMEDLDFSKEQMESVHDVIEKYHPELGERMEQIAIARGELMATIHGEVFDESAVRSACKKLAAIEEEQAVLQANVAYEVQVVMTPDQRAKVQKHIQEMRAKLKDHVGAADRMMKAHEGMSHEDMMEFHHGKDGECPGHGDDHK